MAFTEQEPYFSPEEVAQFEKVLQEILTLNPKERLHVFKKIAKKKSFHFTVVDSVTKKNVTYYIG